MNSATVKNLPVDTTGCESEAHRHACEVRYVAGMRSDEDRRRYLDGVHQRRGKDAWQRLRQDVWALMRRVAA